jgi:hypothetical protein
MNPDKALWHHIFLAGVLGGLLAWLIAATFPGYFSDKIISLEIAKYILGGGLASMVGVYVIANTDTAQFARAASFAAICGLTWPTVLDSAVALISKSVKDRPAAEVSENIKNTREALVSTPNVSTIAAATASVLAGGDELQGAASPEIREKGIQEANALIFTLKRLKVDQPDLAVHTDAALKNLAARETLPQAVRDAAK